MRWWGSYSPAGPAPGAAGLYCLRRLDSARFLSTSLLQLLQVPAPSSLANSLSPKLRPGTAHSRRPNAALNSCGRLLLGCIERLFRIVFSLNCILLGERHEWLRLPLDYLGHHRQQLRRSEGLWDRSGHTEKELVTVSMFFKYSLPLPDLSWNLSPSCTSAGEGCIRISILAPFPASGPQGTFTFFLGPVSFYLGLYFLLALSDSFLDRLLQAGRFLGSFTP